MIIQEIKDSILVKEKIIKSPVLLSLIEKVAKQCLNSLQSGGKIILAGNGGSFADAQHISAEFTSRYLFDRESLASVCLGANASSISAIANDYGYENVFARELSSIGNKNDIFIAISTSGNSKNIVEAINVSNKKGIKSFVLTGESGGVMNEMTECINVPSCVTGRIQESHIMIGHIICGIVEKEYFHETAEKY